MTEGLGETANALSNLCDAVKLLKSMREKNSELYRILEATKRQADEVKRLDIPDEPLLQELKQHIRKVSDSGLMLKVTLQSFGRETDSFDSYVQDNIRLRAFPPEVVAEFCKRLTEMHNMASDFYEALDNFTCYLDEAQTAAVSLMDSLKKKAEKMEKDANSAKNRATGKTVGLTVLGGAGFAALGFFTGGIGWAVGAGVAGAGAGALTARVVNSSSAANVKEMRELASGILKSANKLGAIAKELKSSSDRAGEMMLNEGDIEHLQTVLEFFIGFQQRDKDNAAKQMTIENQQSRIAELEAKLRSLGHRV